MAFEDDQRKGCRNESLSSSNSLKNNQDSQQKGIMEQDTGEMNTISSDSSDIGAHESKICLTDYKMAKLFPFSPGRILEKNRSLQSTCTTTLGGLNNFNRKFGHAQGKKQLTGSYAGLHNLEYFQGAETCFDFDFVKDGIVLPVDLSNVKSQASDVFQDLNTDNINGLGSEENDYQSAQTKILETPEDQKYPVHKKTDVLKQLGEAYAKCGWEEDTEDEESSLTLLTHTEPVEMNDPNPNNMDHLKETQNETQDKLSTNTNTEVIMINNQTENLKKDIKKTDSDPIQNDNDATSIKSVRSISGITGNKNLVDESLVPVATPESKKMRDKRETVLDVDSFINLDSDPLVPSGQSDLSATSGIESSDGASAEESSDFEVASLETAASSDGKSIVLKPLNKKPKVTLLRKAIHQNFKGIDERKSVNKRNEILDKLKDNKESYTNQWLNDSMKETRTIKIKPKKSSKNPKLKNYPVINFDSIHSEENAECKDSTGSSEYNSQIAKDAWSSSSSKQQNHAGHTSKKDLSRKRKSLNRSTSCSSSNSCSSSQGTDELKAGRRTQARKRFLTGQQELKSCQQEDAAEIAQAERGDSPRFVKHQSRWNKHQALKKYKERKQKRRSSQNVDLDFNNRCRSKSESSYNRKKQDTDNVTASRRRHFSDKDCYRTEFKEITWNSYQNQHLIRLTEQNQRHNQICDKRLSELQSSFLKEGGKRLYRSDSESSSFSSSSYGSKTIAMKPRPKIARLVEEDEAHHSQHLSRAFAKSRLHHQSNFDDLNRKTAHEKKAGKHHYSQSSDIDSKGTGRLSHGERQMYKNNVVFLQTDTLLEINTGMFSVSTHFF